MNLDFRKQLSHISKVPLSLFLALLFEQCSNPSGTSLPMADKGNGGLFLPGGFEALVVVDGIGETRHIAVSNNTI